MGECIHWSREQDWQEHADGHGLRAECEPSPSLLEQTRPEVVCNNREDGVQTGVIFLN